MGYDKHHNILSDLYTKRFLDELIRLVIYEQVRHAFNALGLDRKKIYRSRS
jgi:hypothetical protein